MKKYIQPETMITEVVMTNSLLVGSAGPAPDSSLSVSGGGDPLEAI